MPFRLILISFFSLNTQIGFSQINQVYIDSQLASEKTELRYVRQENLINGFIKYIHERRYKCNDEYCLEKKFGISKDSTFLHPIFDELIVLKTGNFYLRKGDSTGIMNQKFELINDKTNPIRRDGEYFLFEEDSVWGILDSALSVIINQKYDSIGEVFSWIEYSVSEIPKSHQYYFKAKKGHYWAVKNMKDSVVFDFKYDEIYPHIDGAVVQINARQGYIDHHKRIRVPIQYDSVICGFGNCIVIQNKKIALFSILSDTLLTKFKYSQFTHQSPQHCRCLKGPNGWEVLSMRGERIGDFYESIKDYSSDVVPVSNNGKWGFVDCRSKKVISELKYDRILRFFGHEAIVLYKGEDMKISFEP